MATLKSRKFRILFVGEEVTLAHVTRPMVLANALDPRRFDIHFACGPKYKHFLKKAHFSTHNLPSISAEKFLKRLEKGAPLYTLNEIENYIENEMALLSQVGPDLIVGDFRLSLGITAPHCQIPYINLTNGHWSPFSTERFPAPEITLTKLCGVKIAEKVLNMLAPQIFRYHARSFNKLRKRYNLSQVSNLRDVYTHGDWTLYTDLPSFAPTANTPSNHRYIGPVIWSPEMPLPPWWEDFLSKKSKSIYVTMGSSGDTNVLTNIISAISGIGIKAIVATAGRKDVSMISNLYVADYLPALEIIKETSLVICNGGSATVYQALAMGRPVLGFPSNADQFFTMKGVTNNGAGMMIRPSIASTENISQAINQLLNVESFRASAENLSKAISDLDATKVFPELIDEITFNQARPR